MMIGDKNTQSNVILCHQHESEETQICLYLHVINQILHFLFNLIRLCRQVKRRYVAAPPVDRGRFLQVELVLGLCTFGQAPSLLIEVAQRQCLHLFKEPENMCLKDTAYVPSNTDFIYVFILTCKNCLRLQRWHRRE